MTDQTSQVGKAVFVGNIKGGVGKSTIAVYLTDYLRQRFAERSIMMIDTDPQGSAFEMLEPHSNGSDIKFLPVGDRYDGVNVTTLDGILRRMLAEDNSLTIVDTGAGKMGDIWQMAMLCNTMIVPTSMSWTDLRPTIDFIKEIDERKADFGRITPHVIVIPNRTSPSQRNFNVLSEALQEVNAIMAPPISDLSAARSRSASFGGIKAVEGSRFHTEIERLGEFIVDYVVSGELDRIYQQ
ncbi:ParA family protein [Candidatus Puniceispirillum marinum]|uniref:Cobyrinic acid a,c-diamide synthase n=1 Tax=Puniceispirillum marinum (strain IMCC1322) TaxID=488538 RepID=D5BR43_PUNMI|nr:ParA family protein [Candidatus Puniceispirillum marinum]ADE40779.1 Cobyrinic acid a,c-diamide synthase [Candidatus Puniceispirillum marinum IMCC1322]